MKLVIKKFKAIEQREVAIPTKIKGANKVGKTTILEAISFCLTGKDLDGSTFAEIYDTNVPLKEAVADVTYFDDYGNSWRREVKPTFRITRQGEEVLQTLRSTTCYKNDIAVSDYADEFEHFEKFGTDYFFSQKESDQRAIFINLLKSQLPDYDVQTAQLELKSLQKSQRKMQGEIKDIVSFLNSIKDVDVVPISANLSDAHKEYSEFVKSSSKHDEQIAEINKKNNELISAFNSKKSNLLSEISEIERTISQTQHEIEDCEKKLKETKESELTPLALTDVSNLKSEIADLETELKGLNFYNDLKDFAEEIDIFSHPLFKENIDKMAEIARCEDVTVLDWVELTDVCPTCGVKSEEFELKQKQAQTEILKNKNRKMLNQLMKEQNAKFEKVNNELTAKKASLDAIKKQNESLQKDYDLKLSNFDKSKNDKILNLKNESSKHQIEIEKAKNELQKFEKELSELKEPKLLSLPETLEISDELKQLEIEYQNARDERNKLIGVNENNAKLRAEKEKEKSEMQGALLELDSKIIKLQNEITEYFANLKGVVKKEFAGKYDIDVELLELVITTKEYKDVFKITANGRVFPYECNGAMINNVKLQLLNGMQRLAGYNGVTILDNVEANTTEALNAYDLKLVSAQATFDKELLIK